MLEYLPTNLGADGAISHSFQAIQMKGGARRKRIYGQLAATSYKRAASLLDTIAAKGNDIDFSPAELGELFERAAKGLSEDLSEKVPLKAAR